MLDKLQIYLQIIVDYLLQVGLVGGFLLIVLESIIPALPLSVFIGLNIITFGKILGYVISYFGTIVGCMLSFITFRYILKNYLYKIFKENELSTSQLAMTTSLMIYNRKHYRTQIKEYREHLKRKQYAWLYFWLYTPFPRLMRSILLPFVWLYNRWIQPRGANAFK